MLVPGTGYVTAFMRFWKTVKTLILIPHLTNAQALGTPHLNKDLHSLSIYLTLFSVLLHTLRYLIKGYTRLFDFRNFDTLPSLIRVYLLIKFWKSVHAPRLFLPYYM